MYEAIPEVHTPPPGIPNRDMIPGYTVGATDPDRYRLDIINTPWFEPPPTTWQPYVFPEPFIAEAIASAELATGNKKIEASAKKVPLAMIPLGALSGVARVFAYGADKYAPGNFIAATIEDGAGQLYISAALRHLALMQHRSGLHTEESLGALDEESGLPHIDHAIASLVMLRAIATKDGAMPADPKEG